MKPFLSYYGGKWRLAPKYNAPKHKTVIEPFAGGAGYSIRHHEHDVKLYDLDPKVVAVWEFLIGSSRQDILNLPINFDHIDDLKVSQEAKWFIGWHLNKGAAQPSKSPSKWMRDERYTNQFWGAHKRDVIANQVENINHWTVEQKSYEQIHNRNATWFVDPPYQEMGKFYKCSADDIDFSHLGEWCKSRKGHVIVCENEGADWLPFEPFVKGHNTAHKTKKNMEVIYEQ